MHNIKSAILENDLRDCPYCGHKYCVQTDPCLASALMELELTKSNTITADALNEELNSEVRERRPPGEDKGRTVLVPEKMFREMRGVCMLDAIRRGYYEDCD